MDYSKNWKKIVEAVLLCLMTLACVFFLGVLIYFGVGKIIYKGVTAFFGFASSLSENFVLAFLGVVFWIFLYAVAIFVYAALVYCCVAVFRFFVDICKGEKITREKLAVYLAITGFCFSLGLYVSIVNIPHFWGYLTSILIGLSSFVCFVLCDGPKNIKIPKEEKENKKPKEKLEKKENKKEVE